MKKDKINRYYNINSAIEVLSSLLNKPSLLNKNEYVLREEDFVTPTQTAQKLISFSVSFFLFSKLNPILERAYNENGTE